MARKPLIVGNWKMHLDHLEAIALVQRLAYHLDGSDHEAADIVVAPAFTALRSVQTLIDGDRLRLGLGAQDCHPEDAGAHTGEVSAAMLAKLTVAFVVVGHSERRAAGESDDLVHRKATAVLRHGMTPVVCVGETLQQREAGEAEAVVTGQLRGALADLDTEQAGRVVVAYEPVWAIGTGRTATAEDAQSMCAHVRAVVADLHAETLAEGLRVQYGGSVKPGNVAALMAQPDIDGALVGGASLDADDFAVVCRFHRL